MVRDYHIHHAAGQHITRSMRDHIETVYNRNLRLPQKNRLSLRQLARELGLPRSTLHDEIHCGVSPLRTCWDGEGRMTDFGGIVSFAEYLREAGFPDRLLRGSLLRYSSPNAPDPADVMGTFHVAVLAARATSIQQLILGLMGGSPPAGVWRTCGYPRRAPLRFRQKRPAGRPW